MDSFDHSPIQWICSPKNEIGQYQGTEAWSVLAADYLSLRLVRPERDTTTPLQASIDLSEHNLPLLHPP